MRCLQDSTVIILFLTVNIIAADYHEILLNNKIADKRVRKAEAKKKLKLGIKDKKGNSSSESSSPNQQHFLGPRVLSKPEECARMCKDEEPPKICYWSFHVENYGVMGPACDLCTPNNTNQIVQDCECVTGDGVEKTIFAVNRMMPGPSIQVCAGDKVVIDVINNIEGEEITIHWHGLLQKGSPYYDGVPFVTQCPIHQGNSFRYQFIAKDAGTQFYHSHSGLQKMNGLAGSLVVRQPPSQDASYSYYDYDLTTTVFFIQDIFHTLAEDKFPGHFKTKTGQDPDNILINGRGQYTDPNTNETTVTPLEKFILEPGFRYRFRLINAMCSMCPSKVTIEGHNLTIIEIDGYPIDPINVTSIISFSGERYDFVVTTDQPVGTYWIQVRGLGSCTASGVQQLATLTYRGVTSFPSSSAPTYAEGLDDGLVLNPLDALCNVRREDAICISQLNSSSLKTVDYEVLSPTTPVQRLCLPFKFRMFTTEDIFSTGNPPLMYLISSDGSLTAGQVNNITYMSPPSPLLSQIEDVNPSILCHDNKRPNCTVNCTCTHVIDIPLDTVMEVILVDEVGIEDLSHPFHLHGTSFHVVAEGLASDLNVTKISAKYVEDMDEAGYITRRSHSSPLKDVIAVPSNGYVVLRFRATNPGYWFMHCHFMYHTAAGMNLVLHIGDDSDLPPVPKNFPKCSNFQTEITDDFDSVL